MRSKSQAAPSGGGGPCPNLRVKGIPYENEVVAQRNIENRAAPGRLRLVATGLAVWLREFTVALPLLVGATFMASSSAFGATILRDGKNLIWFPEGERSTSGELKDFKPGIGMLLERFPAAIIPVFLHGTHEALPPGKHLPRLHAIRVVFGEPLSAGELKVQGRGEKPHEQITSALHDKLAEIVRACH